MFVCISRILFHTRLTKEAIKDWFISRYACGWKSYHYVSQNLTNGDQVLLKNEKLFAFHETSETVLEFAEPSIETKIVLVLRHVSSFAQQWISKTLSRGLESNHVSPN